MKLTQLDKWGLGILAALFLTLAACESTGEIKCDFSTFGTSGSVLGRWNNREAQIDETRGNARVDIEFRDAQGNSIAGSGATGVGPGQSVPIPNGATTMTVSGPSNAASCTGCTGGGGMLEGDDVAKESDSDHTEPVQKWMYVFPLEADLDVSAPGFGPLSNTYASFDFLVGATTTASRLWGMVASIVLADMGNQPAVPSNVTVNFLSRMIPDQSGLGARLYVADRTAEFQSFRFELDGVTRATLSSSSLVYAAPLGWQVIEVRVPATALALAGYRTLGTHSFRVEADTLEGDNEGCAGLLVDG